jgi:ubiquinone/menaquinone biosynthesis C-methylase UbiE
MVEYERRLVMVNDNIENIRAQFTRQAEAYAASVQASDEAAHARVVEICSPALNDRVLDVACGPGFLTMSFALRCATVVGLDATDALLALAQAEAERRGINNVRFERGLATALPFDDASFDIAVCRAAFHHFPEPGRVLSEMSRVIRPDGKIMTADFVTSDDPSEAEAHNEIERLCDPTHVKTLTGTEFRELYRRNGLKIISDLTRKLHYDLDEWIVHGGPVPEIEAEIRLRFQQALKQDGTGLHVRHEEGKIRFTHQTLMIIGVSGTGMPVSG